MKHLSKRGSPPELWMAVLLLLALPARPAEAQGAAPAPSNGSSPVRRAALADLKNSVEASEFADAGDGSPLHPWTSASGTGGIYEAYQEISAKSGGRLRMPAGRYLITKCVNLTSNSGIGIGPSAGVAPLLLEGDGRGRTILVGQSGGCILDATGTGENVFRDFSLIQGGTNKSIVGILLGRSRNGLSQYSESNQIENIYCALPTIPTANAGHGTVCLYDFAAESGRFINDEFHADNPIVLTGSNIYDISSYVQQGTIGFVSENVIAGGVYDAQGLASGQSILLEGAADNTNIESVTLTRAGKTPPLYPLRILGAKGHPDTPIRGLRATGLQIEVYGRLLSTDAKLDGPVLAGTSQQDGGPIILLSGSYAKLVNANIDLIAAAATPTAPLIGDGSAGSGGLTGGIIHLYRGQTIALGHGPCSGMLVLSSFPSPSISCSRSGANMIIAPEEDNVKVPSPPKKSEAR